jgi:hypothetical protein
MNLLLCQSHRRSQYADRHGETCLCDVCECIVSECSSRFMLSVVIGESGIPPPLTRLPFTHAHKGRFPTQSAAVSVAVDSKFSPHLRKSTMNSLKQISLVGLCMVLASQSAPAQQFNPGRIKSNGEAMQGHEVQAYQHLAQQRAQTLYYYAQPQQPVANVPAPPPMTMVQAKELVTGIKKDLTASDAALAKIKAEHAKEPEVIKQIALIEKHHAKAHEVCGTAEEHCLKEHGDHVEIANCCSEMYHELDAAKAETTKLLKMLKIEKLDPPKKVQAKATEKK